MRRLAPAVLLAACVPALREPAALPPAAGPTPASELLAEAESAWARRPDGEAVRRAERLFLEAAAADPAAVRGLTGAVFAKAWLAEHTADREARAALAGSAVEAGQWCLRRAPQDPACAYALALGLGLQARERPETSTDGLALMVRELRRAAADPAQDRGGPHRVLALVLLRAPGWPLGPGDPEAALAEARRAAELFPEFPPNQAALGEALAAAGEGEAARRALWRALDLARAREGPGDPDAPDWIREAERLLGR